ncbi:PREDICTED: ephrin type-B receptor 2-like, partial [Priapulus caudatus]|uniref:Ephrin type-B receptor 2-like n=1 Tax=Priapulus caudatus TaxID=37621 RepID=A0ABM1F5R2_PRICU
WVEDQYFPHKGDSSRAWRVYAVCDIGSQAAVENWLRMPYIERGAAERLYIEVKFSMRDCKHFPAIVRSCKETFSLLYYESEFDFSSTEMPTWNTKTYRMIDRIAADKGRFSDNNEIVVNVEQTSVRVGKKGVFIAFQDEGACLSLLAIRVYYKACPLNVSNYAVFPQTPTGEEVSSVKQADGTCVDNSVQMQRPTYLCTGSGRWSLLQGGCECLPGYQAVERLQSCEGLFHRLRWGAGVKPLGPCRQEHERKPRHRDRHRKEDTERITRVEK